MWRSTVGPRCVRAYVLYIYDVGAGGVATDGVGTAAVQAAV
jgi:hypothetical protein